MKKITESSVRKIVLVNSDNKQLRKMGDVGKIAENTGDSEKFRGYEATCPSIYLFREDINKALPVGEFLHMGNYYKEHISTNPDVRVFCLEEEKSQRESTLAIEEFVALFE